jgi:hypothetical protein
MNPLSNKGQACPCCGYDTLSERNADEICPICWWEDDGQDNQDADRVFGGPNADLSLRQARINFLKYGIGFPDRKDLHSRSRDGYKQLRHFHLTEKGDVIESKTNCGFRRCGLSIPTM